MSDETGGEGSGPRVLTLGAPSLETGAKYDPEPRREETRSFLSTVLLYLDSLVAVLLIVLAAAGLLTIDEAKDLALAVLSPLVAVTGTVFGFYFSGSSHRKHDA